MKKRFLIILLMLFGTLCFAESNKEKYTKMITIFCEKGSCVIFVIPELTAVVPKTTVSTIRLYDEYVQILYINGGSWNTANYSGCKIYLDKNNNLVIEGEWSN